MPGWKASSVKPLSFALAVVHGDDGEGVFWFMSPNSPNMFSGSLAEELTALPTTSKPKADQQSHQAGRRTAGVTERYLIY